MCLQYCLYELVIFIHCKHYVPCCTLIIHSKSLSITQLSDYIRQWRRSMIRSKRREIGLSQSELARRIRKNKSYVSRLERKVNNYHPSMYTSSNYTSRIIIFSHSSTYSISCHSISISSTK